MDFARWITDYLASYLEDVADLGDNFDHAEALTLGFAATSIMKNIVERFLELAPPKREEVIAALHGHPVVEEDSGFTQEFIPSIPVAPICKAGVDLIKAFEGCRLEAYQCPAGLWTIGYGHTHGVRYGQSITQAQADAYLVEDITEAWRQVMRLVTVPLNPHQVAALTSFVYNLGAVGLETSTLLKRLNAGDYACVPAELSRWVYASAAKLPGLVRRREAEARLFTKAIS